jgi:Tetratricopeptide repeat
VRISCSFLAILAAATIPGAVSPSIANDDHDILESKGVDVHGAPSQRVSACTEVISSDTNSFLKARHLFFRASAYMEIGIEGLDTDRGLDYFRRAASDYAAASEVPRDSMDEKQLAFTESMKSYASDAKSVDGCLNQSNEESGLLSCSELIDDKSGPLAEAFRALAYKQRAYAYMSRSDNNRAIVELNNSLALDNTNWAAYGMRGGAYFKLGQYDLAISDLTKAEEINNRSEDVYVLRCGAYTYKGQYKKAISDCDEALRINPKSTDAAGARRWALDQQRLASRAPSPPSTSAGSGKQNNMWGRMLCNKMLGTNPLNIMSPCN